MYEDTFGTKILRDDCTLGVYSFIYFILKDMHVMGQHLKMRVKRSDKVVCAENWDGQKV